MPGNSFFRHAAAVAVTLLWAAGFSQILRAQSSTTGFVAGVITDPSGLAIPQAKVTLSNPATSSNQAASTGRNGAFRFSFVAPGNYTLEVNAVGFRAASQPVTVIAGQGATANFRLQLATSTSTVTVASGAAVVQTQDAAVSTYISEARIAQVPAPGQDITSVAQTSPGAMMNTEGGGGSNFSMYGLPATGNVMQMNGMDITNLYNENNQSGATNLTLGLNELGSATLVTNAYGGENGRSAGSQVLYISKSGSNKWHGDAAYYWGGDLLNANDYFNNKDGVARPFANANQWAASLGGPIIKNRTFFFVDQEGIRVLLPTSSVVNIPSPQFEAATIANLTTNSPASVPFYKQLFSLYNGAPNAHLATNSLANGGCGTFTALGAGVPCALQFHSAPTSLITEWTLATRLDQVVDKDDRFFIRVETEHGFRTDSASPFTPALNIQGSQPEWQGQFSETHIFSGTAVNNFVAGFRWISVLDGAPNFTTAANLLPFEVSLVGNAFTHVGEDNSYLTGRIDLDYEYSDNFSYVDGAHTLRLGLSMRRDRVSDDTGTNVAGTALSTLQGLYNGQADTSFSQAFVTSTDLPLTIYSLGWYAEDDWHVSNHLNLTLAARFAHNSTPVCRSSCFGVLTAPFQLLSHAASIPYDEALNPSARGAFFESTAVDVLPRIGFAWTPFARQNTVVRGGFGVFDEALPGSIAASFAANPPNVRTFTVTGPLSPASSGSAISALAADNAAFTSGFATGATLAQLQTEVPGFAPPSLYTAARSIKDGLYREWNLEVQRALGGNMGISVNYVGNYGYNEAFVNLGVNAYCPASACPGGYGDLPASAPDVRFATVTQIQTDGKSNYNGVSISFHRNMTKGLLVSASYTYGHSLDDVSNGGFEGFNGDTDRSILSPQDPYNPGANYGNSDYDIRHAFNASYVWQVPGPAHERILDRLLGGWVVSGTLFVHTGFPFTVIDSAQAGVLSKYNYSGATIRANFLGGPQPSCGVGSPCLLKSQFGPPTTGFGSQERNQLRGPGYFDTDLSLMKNIPLTFITENAQLSLGIQFFNLFNHPNFDLPESDLSNSSFGLITSTVSVPTSPFGTGLGGDASPRLGQLQAKINF